jgi:hypothetical protein
MYPEANTGTTIIVKTKLGIMQWLNDNNASRKHCWRQTCLNIQSRNNAPETLIMRRMMQHG